MADEPTIADTVRHAASELRALAARAEHKDRSVMLDPPECRAIADSWEHQADDMDNTTGVREALLIDDMGDDVPVVIDRYEGRHHDWTATLAAARALLGES